MLWFEITTCSGTCLHSQVQSADQANFKLTFATRMYLGVARGPSKHQKRRRPAQHKQATHKTCNRKGQEEHCVKQAHEEKGITGLAQRYLNRKPHNILPPTLANSLVSI